MTDTSSKFKDLPTEAPADATLKATCDANIMHAKSTANFDDISGYIQPEKISIEVPVLAIVCIPSLQVDEVNVLFDMEVKSTEKSDSSDNATAPGGTFKASAGS